MPSVPGLGTAGVVTRTVLRGASALLPRVPTADLDDRDVDVVRDQLPALWLLASYYFRARVRGLERIPAEGPVLMVGNHSGGNVTPDTMVFALAFSAHFGAERRFHALVHNALIAMAGPIPVRTFGAIAASSENARLALSRGAALLVYPGGDVEVSRPSWQSGRVDFDGRKGFIRLALQARVPIVPVVSIGGQETALFLTQGKGLARLLGVDRRFRMKTMPISLALPWGINIGDFLLHWPLPAKITIQVLDPIDLYARYGQQPDVDQIYDDLIASMQGALTNLAAERRFPVVG